MIYRDTQDMIMEMEKQRTGDYGNDIEDEYKNDFWDEVDRAYNEWRDSCD